jgi:hypothetical protein
MILIESWTWQAGGNSEFLTSFCFLLGGGVRAILVSLQRLAIGWARTFNPATATVSKYFAVGFFCMITRQEGVHILLDRSFIQPRFEAASRMGHSFRKDMSIGSLVELWEVRNESRRKEVVGSRFPKAPSANGFEL